MEITKINDFLEKFKQMESLLRSKYKIDNIDSLSNLFENPELKKYRERFHIVRQIRNLYSHRSLILLEDYINIDDKMINFIDEVIFVLNNPKKIVDYCVKLKDITYAAFEEDILPYIEIMIKNKFNTIPILEDGVVKGVFTENSLLQAVHKDEIIMIDKNTKFIDIKDSLSLENGVENFFFIKPTTTVQKLFKRYYNEFNQGKRITIYFITENGKSDGKLIGFVTPYRIASFNNL